MVNTEKPMAIAEQKRQAKVETPKQPVPQKAPIEPKKQTSDNQLTTKAEGGKKPSEHGGKEQTPKEPQKPIIKKESAKRKKTEAVVRGVNVSISTKYSTAICRFIMKKKIGKAIADLELVLQHKKHIPMKGEIPHRKGPGKRGSGAGRYVNNATEAFIRLLKSLQANAIANDLDNPIIVEAVANIGARPYGRFGNMRRKRTHITITAKEKKTQKKSTKKIGGKK